MKRFLSLFLTMALLLSCSWAVLAAAPGSSNLVADLEDPQDPAEPPDEGEAPELPEEPENPTGSPSGEPESIFGSEPETIPDSLAEALAQIQLPEPPETVYQTVPDVQPVEPQEAQSAADFTDVPAGAWYYGELDLLVSLGGINGMTPTAFCPDDTMTVEQFIKVLVGCTFSPEALAYYLRRLGPYLSTDGNRIGVSYQTLREASGERYAAYAKCQHTALAEACREFDPVECLYHHRAAENWTELAALSEDIRFLCCGIQHSGALRLRAELEAAENMVSGETLSCLRQTAALIGRDNRLAAPLFYKELRSPSLREQAAALCKAPWLRYEPIPAEAPVEAEPAAFQTEFTSEHMGAQGFCLAERERITFLLLGEADVSVRDLRTRSIFFVGLRQNPQARMLARRQVSCCGRRGSLAASVSDHAGRFSPSAGDQSCAVGQLCLGTFRRDLPVHSPQRPSVAAGGRDVGNALPGERKDHRKSRCPKPADGMLRWVHRMEKREYIRPSLR